MTFVHGVISVSSVTAKAHEFLPNNMFHKKTATLQDKVDIGAIAMCKALRDLLE